MDLWIIKLANDFGTAIVFTPKQPRLLVESILKGIIQNPYCFFSVNVPVFHDLQ